MLKKISTIEGRNYNWINHQYYHKRKSEPSNYVSNQDPIDPISEGKYPISEGKIYIRRGKNLYIRRGRIYNK